MALFTRVSRLLAADLHAVIDRLEEPQAQLQQAMREMQQVITQLEQQHQQVEAKLGKLTEQQQSLRAQHEATGSELELCLDASETELARAVVRRSLQLEALLAQVEAELKLARTKQTTTFDLLAEHKTEYEALASQAQLLEVEQPQAPTPSGGTITEAQIDIALLAHQQRRAQS